LTPSVSLEHAEVMRCTVRICHCFLTEQKTWRIQVIFDIANKWFEHDIEIAMTLTPSYCLLTPAVIPSLGRLLPVVLWRSGL
jgi:hypothetical protein